MWIDPVINQGAPGATRRCKQWILLELLVGMWSSWHLDFFLLFQNCERKIDYSSHWNFIQLPQHCSSVVGVSCLWYLYQKGDSVQFSSVTQLCPNLCDPMVCSTPVLPVHHQLLEFTQTHVHRVSDAIQPSHPLSSPSPPAFNLSQHQGLFKWVSSLYQVAKYWSFSFNISLSNRYSRLISFRMDWLNLLTVQGTLKSLLQHHSSKASILLHSAFIIVQHSHPYTTTGKTIALTRQIFVGKVTSLLFKLDSSVGWS